MATQAEPSHCIREASPNVPTPVNQLQVKKRVVNLVNPADAQVFSHQSTSPIGSPISTLTRTEVLTTKTPSPPILPRLSELQQQAGNLTPNSNGVKGILRPSGTPGSGNGVRFFHKKQFRVITPNSSVLAPSPAKPPPTPTSSSFFSQLLAATMSPRRKEPESEPEPEGNEESWEKPGEEGEVSLVASTGSAGSIIIHSDEDAEDAEEEEPWNGEPQIHCSPLGLPAVPEGTTSKDASYGEFELPSVEWHLPEDMSNLLSTRFPEKDSFSVADPTSTSTIASPRGLPADQSSFRDALTSEAASRSLKRSKMEKKAEAEFWGVHPDESTISEIGREDSNPTIRCQLPPFEEQIPAIEEKSDTQEPPLPIAQPVPAMTPPYSTSSIFADMSAEQAELTWPLTHRPGSDSSSTFQSPNRLQSPELPEVAPETPGTTVGDVTEFYDCTAMVLSPSSDSTLAICSTSTPLTSLLVPPTKALFEAQTAHTDALSAELELYKDLTEKLRNEVSERDEVLAKLNMGALETEMLYSQVQDLKKELAVAKAKAEQAKVQAQNAQWQALPNLDLNSPTPLMRTRSVGLPSDRTIAAQSEARDLEIRLAKALADASAASRQLDEVKKSRDHQALELEEAQAELRDKDDREKSRMIKASHPERNEEDGEVEKMRKEMGKLQRKVEEMEGKGEEVEALRQELEEVYRQLEEVKDQGDEVQALKAELSSAHHQLDEYELTKADVGALQKELADLRHHVQELKQVKAADEEEIEILLGQVAKLETESREVEDLKYHFEQLKQVKTADEEEIENLLRQVEKFKAERRQEDDWKSKVKELNKRVDMEGMRRQEVELKLEEIKSREVKLEGENRELRKSLQSTREQLAQAQSAPTTSSADAQELQSLRVQIDQLKSQSASKDLEITNLQRRKAELKEDREMLNIALDSKQQEVELMKRKFGVRGVAGSTPLGASQRTNLDRGATPSMINESFLPKTRTRHRSSLAIQTPVPGYSKRHSLETPLQGDHRHGVQLYPSTKITSRVMQKSESSEENTLPSRTLMDGSAARYGSLRTKERKMTLA
ncbi:hypothetical protein J010_04600 [Cryptococcus neoformans]|nr:hypothetical protein C353_04701 [Cryptococcus neoformans var. grubii AD1-83a]OXG47738.1 hypothetical protein C355_04798 [Cryptococcus neoformans var. grubii Th84]OXG54737.1 hypothetical protein C354_04633 [Cryptococcus neoformans var. grubii MW-RSA1955]OXG58014.1 hypothetical protein C352_04618 [Cryptococcus neoformans var. grubii CHC193]OXG61051.1 hypothetical protein C351_04584 [Cryptococcus neoformans var. grubii c8]OXG76592.1 hypothetical protein C350_04582 [Cryptococcus neoformans var.